MKDGTINSKKDISESFVTKQSTVTGGGGAVAFGSASRAYHHGVFVCGASNISNANYQVLVGQCSNPRAPKDSSDKSYTLFAVGNGEGVASKSNAFEVTFDGRAKV